MLGECNLLICGTSRAELRCVDFFLPFDLEYTCVASSILTTVEDILKCIRIPKATKALADQILGDIADSGNAVARLRQTELQDLRRLGMKLWQKNAINDDEDDAILQQRNDTHVASMAPPPTRTTRYTVTTAPNNLPNSGTDGMPINQSIGLSLTNQQLPTLEPGGLQAVTSFNDSITTFSPTSSQDLAYNFDLARDEMLVLADQIDVDALQESLDFDLNGDFHWILENTP